MTMVMDVMVYITLISLLSILIMMGIFFVYDGYIENEREEMMIGIFGICVFVLVLIFLLDYLFNNFMLGTTIINWLRSDI